MCLMLVTTWDVAIVVMAINFWIGIVVGVLVGLSLPLMLVCMAEVRQKSALNNLVPKKVLTEDDRSFLSFLTITQALQLPSSKVR